MSKELEIPRLTRKIQQWEIETYNLTRPDNDKFVSSDYMCKKSAYEREILNKLGRVEDIEEKHNIKSPDDLDKRLTALNIIKKIGLLAVYQDNNGKCFVAFLGRGSIEIPKEDYDSLKELFLLKLVAGVSKEELS